MNEDPGLLHHDWNIFDIQESGISISIDFNSPVSVSKGDAPDLVFVQLELGDLRSRDGIEM